MSLQLKQDISVVLHAERKHNRVAAHCKRVTLQTPLPCQHCFILAHRLLDSYIISPRTISPLCHRTPLTWWTTHHVVFARRVFFGTRASQYSASAAPTLKAT